MDCLDDDSTRAESSGDRYKHKWHARLGRSRKFQMASSSSGFDQTTEISKKLFLVSSIQLIIREASTRHHTAAAAVVRKAKQLICSLSKMFLRVVYILRPVACLLLVLIINYRGRHSSSPSNFEILLLLMMMMIINHHLLFTQDLGPCYSPSSGRPGR